MGDVVLEMNGYPVGGNDGLQRLQQLAEAEPPLCLTLAARSQQSLEAGIPPGIGKVRKRDIWSYEQPEKVREEPERSIDWEDCWVTVWGLQVGT